MATRLPVDFDGEPRQLIENFYSLCDDAQRARNQQCRRDYLLYRHYVDMTNRDPSLPNIAIPKIFSIVEQKSPQSVKALFGSRPYVPFESRDKGNPYAEMSAEIATELIDEYLERAGVFVEYCAVDKLATLYGTAFMEAVPYYESVMAATGVLTPNGPRINQVPAYRLRFRLRCFAPWELLVDPYAVGLEREGQCRGLIKIRLCSRRDIIKQNEESGGNTYPGLDYDKLRAGGEGTKGTVTDHFGLQILRDFGLQIPQSDDDIGVLLDFESPDRYVSSWNGLLTIRDIDNPFPKSQHGHGGINLVRRIHVLDAHTQNRFWGIGEAKPNEVFQAMMSDQLNTIFRREAITGEPIIFFDPDAVQQDNLLWQTGNRVPVNVSSGKGIQDALQIHAGQEMPKDQFRLFDILEHVADQTAGQYPTSRGDVAPTNPSATEVVKSVEAGTERQELSIRLAEQMFGRRLGELMACHVAQFGQPVDFAEMVGPGRAMMLMTANPFELPGGVNLAFKGSQRVSNLLVKQRNLKELLQPVDAILDKGRFTLAQYAMDTFEMDPDKVEQIVGEAKQMMMMQMQQQAMKDKQEADLRREELAAKTGKPSGGKPGGKYKTNTPAQVAQDSGRAMRGEA